MKTVLTTYLETETAIEIDRESKSVGASKSDFIAQILADREARRRAIVRIKRARQREAVAA